MASIKSEILFRADGNSQIGSGHVMRCLSLADAFTRMGHSCRFLLADATMADMIRGRGFAATVLGSNWQDMEGELPLILPQLASAPRLVVADSYALTPRWLTAVQACCPVAQFDDEDFFVSPANILINYNFSGLDRPYAARYAGRSTRLLLGPSYAPLRPAFAAVPQRQIRTQVQDILVSTGGSDPENAAGHLLAQLAQDTRWQGITFHFVVGALNPRLPGLERAAQALPGVRLHRNVQQMAQLMCACDVAIAAAGSTLYELCACGTPTITYVLADNQTPGAVAFARRGLMENAGDCRTKADFYPHLLDSLAKLCGDAPRRQRMAAVMQRLVDGRGADRLAAALLA